MSSSSSNSNFQIDRFKSQLKLSISRLIFLQKKLTAQSLGGRKEIADLLKANKTDQAITKVRYIVRDDFMVEAMEIVQSFCDDLLKSANLICNTKNCDEFILEQAKSLIYASTRMDVPELAKVRDHLVAKYTKTILPDREIGVYPRLVLKLSMSNPGKELCEQYLEAIADNFGIVWPDDEEEEEEKDEKCSVSENGNESESSHDFNPKTPTIKKSLSSTNTRDHQLSEAQAQNLTLTSSPPPYSENEKERERDEKASKAASAPLPMDYSKQQQQKQQTNLPDFDEFTRRFEALRKK